MGSYIALLRGINVGGKNAVSMAELRFCFEKAGLQKVSTYINSGNVIFESPDTDIQKLTAKVVKALHLAFDSKPPVLILSQAQLQAIVGKAPAGFGSDPAHYRYDVIFLLPPLTLAQAMQVISIKEGVDQVWAGPGVLYFSRLTARAVQSRLQRIIGTPIYQNMTIRNWNTTTKLLGLLEKE